MIKAMLFDLDGTLFDNSEANVKAYSLAFEETGLDFSASEYRKAFGLRFPEMMDKLAPNSTKEQREKVRQLKSQYYKESLSLVKTNNGLISLLKDLRGSYKTALVTTASGHNVENLLTHFLPNENLFDTVIVGEDVDRSKPDPSCYLLAAEKLAMAADECLVFEDSETGVAAAKAAGMAYVKVVL
jgi:HAD superfamily hydrolase (TIGR01509 family)